MEKEQGTNGSVPAAPEAGRPLVEIGGVTKKVRRRALLNNVSFTIGHGEICGLLGPNGAGKTTLIRVMTGLIRPSAGDVTIGGHSVAKERESAVLHVGAIVESPIFFPYMTGRDNLYNLALLHPDLENRQARRQRVREVLEIVRMDKRADEKVKTYSLGMKQRLGIAQALLGDPELLILDEPANGLDPMGIRELRELILRLKNELGKTVLVSSHLLDELQKICDRIVVIREGERVFEGSREAMIGGRESLEEAFVEMMER
ncbi:ABC transporter ATP-binding protein [Saccharibacillus sp. CPCC 101409]|uniref:ABC transporter ATP-binding protein n=1 Tax=Saccharibacillus sp. CPCC 101409 TaxID=3058041 RepID=UPI002672DA69|nr:ABC transporter ATP-binding protein [Saccharibacillus sp. CPCC 101409]MDO3410102.1 ABC transporter ATP-binding protein [Saccharibacillus sp. CPCC 101409]